MILKLILKLIFLCEKEQLSEEDLIESGSFLSDSVITVPLARKDKNPVLLDGITAATPVKV